MTVNRPTPVFVADTDTAETFRTLAQRWRSETGHLSIVQQKVMNRSYLEIIGLGQPALPLLLQELRERPSYWFLALSSIARENPARPGATFDEAVNDWLAWGRARGLID
jgi:hypothetical protein